MKALTKAEILLFDIVWAQLELQGSCDARLSAEWHRVMDEWADANAPENVARFIIEHANMVPAQASSVPVYVLSDADLVFDCEHKEWEVIWNAGGSGRKCKACGMVNMG